MQNEYGKEIALGQELYEAKVGQEMLARSGRNPQGKGVVHEILFRDRLNADPRNILTGRHAQLTKSPTAVRDDLVTTQHGKVVGRYQLKDTERSIAHTVKQSASGKYQGTQLMGTEETTKAYSAASDKQISKLQTMNSTGISSRDTERIANKALGKAVSAESVLSGAAIAGKISGILSGCISMAADLLLNDKEHNCGEIVEDAAKSAATGCVSGAASFAGAEIALGLAKSPLGKIAAPVVGSIAAGSIAAQAAEPVVEGIVDAVTFGEPSFIADGFKDGLDQAGGAILDIAGAGVDLITRGVDIVSDFLDWLLW